MYVLLVDNGSNHIRELQNLFIGHRVQIVKREHFTLPVNNEFELIVLSGSSDISVVGHEEEFREEINCIVSGKTPVLGICLGFELIIYAFGGKLIRLNEKVTGAKSIRILDDAYSGSSPVVVYEGHRWTAPEVYTPLIALASSETGIEMVRHQDRPVIGVQFHPEMMSDNILRTNLLSFIFGILFSHKG